MSKLSIVSRAAIAGAVGVFVVLFSAQSFAKTVHLGRSGFWSIYVYFKDNGTFGHCGMDTGSSVGSETFTLIVSRKGYTIFLDDPNWSLNRGDKYNSITIIGRQKWTGKAVVYSRHGVVMQYSFESEFGPAFMHGHAMDFRIGDFSRELDLTGSDDAVTQLADCLETYLPARNPFGRPRSRPSSHTTGNPFEQ